MCKINPYHITMLQISNMLTINNLLRHLYCCCNRCDVSPSNLVVLKDKEHNVLPNKLIYVINGSKPIKRDDKCHNVASQNKRSRRCDVTYIISVAELGLASQEVTF
jgi:hypothetical protein